MEIYIIGAGGNSKVVIDICNLLNYKILGLFDDHPPKQSYQRYAIAGKIDDIKQYSDINIINSIGDNNTRYKIYQKLEHLKLNWINCIHPQSYMAPSCQIGMGNVICYGSFINSDAILGDFNLINTYAIIEHDCKIGHFNHIAPRTTLCGAVIVGNLNLLGASTTIIPGKIIGNENVIGASTVIISNFGNNQRIVGIPGKEK